MLQKTLRAVFLCAAVAASAAAASAQSSVTPQDTNSAASQSTHASAPQNSNAAATQNSRAATTQSVNAATPEASVQNRGAAATGGLFGFEEMRRQLREQREEIDELRAAFKEQSRLIGELRSRVERTEQQAAQQGPSASVREAAYAPGAVESVRAPGGVEAGDEGRGPGRAEGTSGGAARASGGARRDTVALQRQRPRPVHGHARAPLHPRLRPRPARPAHAHRLLHAAAQRPERPLRADAARLTQPHAHALAVRHDLALLKRYCQERAACLTEI